MMLNGLWSSLLWSIVCVLAGAKLDHSYLKGRIQLGDRPPLDKIDVHQAAGLEDLVELMERCWNDDPEKRPLFTEKHTVSGLDGPVTVEPRLQSSSSGPMSSGNPLRTDSCQLSLDENTASDELILENRKVFDTDERQRRPEHPHRFTSRCQVLSKESLPERSYFELKWDGWSVGVAVSYIDISRKEVADSKEKEKNRKEVDGSSRFGNNDKSWMLWCLCGSDYSFIHNSIETKLSGPDLSTGGDRGKGVFGVHTDHRAGAVSFYCVDGDKQTLLHTVNTTFTQPLYAGIYTRFATAEIC